MGKVDAFKLDGLKCYFPSADHLPQHFEVYRPGAYVVRIYFLRTNKKRGLNWDYKRMMGGEFGPAGASRSVSTRAVCVSVQSTGRSV
jgi:hypothetical protein